MIHDLSDMRKKLRNRAEEEGKFADDFSDFSYASCGAMNFTSCWHHSVSSRCNRSRSVFSSPASYFKVFIFTKSPRWRIFSQACEFLQKSFSFEYSRTSLKPSDASSPAKEGERKQSISIHVKGEGDLGGSQKSEAIKFKATGNFSEKPSRRVGGER